jgi:serine/threonine protein kinase
MSLTLGSRAVARNRVAYLVMEYLDGCTLSDVLQEEDRLPVYWVVDILEQVCSAVHEAHQQGVVHRDLKPDNIWLEPNGLGGYRVKVLDFGIAKLGEAAPLDLEFIPPARLMKMRRRKFRCLNQSAQPSPLVWSNLKHRSHRHPRARCSKRPH